METRREGEWRVGDVVQVDRACTELGEGVVIDVEVDRHGHVRSLLVRFERGPRAGVWYGPGSLRPLRDLYGRPLLARTVGAPTLAPWLAKRVMPMGEDEIEPAEAPARAAAREARRPPGTPSPRPEPAPLHVPLTVGTWVSGGPDGRLGVVTEAPPRFASGEAWPDGWLRVRWADGREDVVYERHLSAHLVLALGQRAEVTAPDSRFRGRLGVVAGRHGKYWQVRFGSQPPTPFLLRELGPPPVPPRRGQRVQVIEPYSWLRGWCGTVVDRRGPYWRVRFGRDGSADDRPVPFLPRELAPAPRAP